MLQRVRNGISDIFRQCDMLLLLFCIIASSFGLLMIASATHYLDTWRYVLIQGVATILGIFMYILISLLDLAEITKKGWKWMLLFNLAFICLLLTPFGVADDTGNRAWLKFPFLPVSVQPAEFVKLTFILVLAKQLDWLKREKNDLKSIGAILFLGANLLLIFGPYYVISSDMGSCLVFLFIFATVCFVAGVALRWFILGVLGGGIAFYLLWELDKIPDYMEKRFLVLFDHSYDALETGWQQTRSLLALGGGKLTGQGLFQGIQTQSALSASLPNRRTDFIFSVVGEELGLLGCIAVLLILTAIIVRCITTARHARSYMEKLTCAGVAGMLLFQMVANVGMCLFVLPVIGLTLPFFSYGGSSVLALYMAMGMVSSAYKHSKPDWLQ